MTPQPYPFSKNRYFPHKRMRAVDFIRDQKYAEKKLAFLSRWDWGTGVASGWRPSASTGTLCWCLPALPWMGAVAG